MLAEPVGRTDSGPCDQGKPGCYGQTQAKTMSEVDKRGKNPINGKRIYKHHHWPSMKKKTKKNFVNILFVNSLE